MTIIAFRLPITRSMAALSASMTVALLTGCAGGSSTGSDPAVTVPATPAVTATGAPRTSEAGPPQER